MFDVKLKLAIVFPCTLDAVVLPTFKLIPRNLLPIEPAIVHAVPPALVVLPPMKLLLITKLLPDVLLI